jgi:hypothetical protein
MSYYFRAKSAEIDPIKINSPCTSNRPGLRVEVTLGYLTLAPIDLVSMRPSS